MKIVDNKIELTKEEDRNFIKQMKIGILKQLHKEEYISSEQLKLILNSYEK